jgi:hypothetical protein
MPIGSSLEKEIVFGFRERNLSRLKGQPMRESSHSIVIENKEQVAPKVEQLRGSHP